MSSIAQAARFLAELQLHWISRAKSQIEPPIKPEILPIHQRGMALLTCETRSYFISYYNSTPIGRDQSLR